MRVGIEKLEETSGLPRPLAQAGNHPRMRMILLLRRGTAGCLVGSARVTSEGTV